MEKNTDGKGYKVYQVKIKKMDPSGCLDVIKNNLPKQHFYLFAGLPRRQ